MRTNMNSKRSKMKYEYFESNDEVRESLERYMTNHHLIFQTYPSHEDVDDVREIYIQSRTDCCYSREDSLIPVTKQYY